MSLRARAGVLPWPSRWQLGYWWGSAMLVVGPSRWQSGCWWGSAMLVVGPSRWQLGYWLGSAMLLVEPSRWQLGYWWGERDVVGWAVAVAVGLLVGERDAAGRPGGGWGCWHPSPIRSTPKLASSASPSPLLPACRIFEVPHSPAGDRLPPLSVLSVAFLHSTL